jgi:hypothetical protein
VGSARHRDATATRRRLADFCRRTPHAGLPRRGRGA